MLPCDIAPPTVDRRPDKGPQYGVRSPCTSSASRRFFHVTPHSTVTYMSVALTSMIWSSLRRSINTEFVSVDKYPPVYDIPPPRATMGKWVGAMAWRMRLNSAALPGCTIAKGANPFPYTSWEKNSRSSSPVNTYATPTMPRSRSSNAA
jgi:hypothetical protein